MAVLVGIGALACNTDAPAQRDRRAERDQLRREVTGYRALEPIARSGLLSLESEILVSLSDTLIRGLIAAAFPVDVRVGGGVDVTLAAATVLFRANVARVEVTGVARRHSFPRIAAAITLRGALDAFEVDSARVLRARITVDDVDVGALEGAPLRFAPAAQAVMQRLLERGLVDLANAMPAVAVPVRFDSEIRLPSLDGIGPLSARGATAPLAVVASRVLAFRDRIWIVLRIDRAPFVTPHASR